MIVPRVALIGVSGYGRVHLEHLAVLHARGELVLVSAVAIDFPDQPETCARLGALGCQVVRTWTDFIQNLPAYRLDLAIVPTPIHLHAQMAVPLLAAGINVLIEKPLSATVADGETVVAAARKAGRLAAIGFQYLHAPEVQALKRRLVRGDIGRLRRIAVHVAWPRSHGYYSRNNWAGRINAADSLVLDSPVANAMAHFFMLLSYFAGPTAGTVARARRMRAELYRAQAIQSFDTAVIALETESGCRLEFYGTHSSRDIVRPTLVVQGDLGTAEWIQDREAQLVGPAGQWSESGMPEAGTREAMLRDVIARLSGEARFVCEPELALEHVRCVNALQEFGRIVEIPPARLAERREDDDTFTYVPGLDGMLGRAFREHTSLQAAGAPWAEAPVEMDLSSYRGIA